MLEMTYNILIADDEHPLRELYKSTLEDFAEYSVHTAADGREALERIKELAHSQTTLDLLITDKDMPKLDGLALIKKVRSLPVYEALPIILISAGLSQQSERNGALEAGANYVIEKPFSPILLLDKISEVLGNRQS